MVSVVSVLYYFSTIFLFFSLVATCVWVIIGFILFMLHEISIRIS